MTRADRLRLAHLGLHPDRVGDLWGRFGSAAGILRAVERGRVRVPEGLREAARVPARDRMDHLGELGVEVVFAEELPEHLGSLPDAPDLLFCRGALPRVPGVAVVGTRRASTYGLRLARAFGRAVGRAGWPVISGLARGVDGEAHRGTLEAGGAGVAVLGSGPDVWYPPEHRDLGEALVAAGGAVVTEYPPGTAPEGWRFPPRNRIISGLSAAVVVVEAGVKGGALITARRALEQGRDVFVVPGDVDRETSRGCNLLIRDGAHPVLGTEDLLEALSLVLGPRPRGGRDESAQDRLVEALGEVGRTVEELASELELPVPELLARLARLEADGAVRMEGGMVVRA